MTLKLAVALTLSQIPVTAQVQSVEILTSGISCGVCAAVSEFQFRRMEGIERVTISLPKEAIVLHYKPDAVFSVPALQSVLDPLKVHILRLRMTARGRIEDGHDGGKLFIAGKNRFAVRLPSSMGVSSADRVFVEGLLAVNGGTTEYRIATLSVNEKGGK